MVGGHLRHPFRRLAADRGARPGRSDAVARLHEGRVAVAALLHHPAGVGDEGVHVEGVVGEQHVVLEMVGACGGVVAQPVQRIVDARCREGRQRPRRAGDTLQRAVDDRVVHVGEIGHIEPVAQRPGHARPERAFHVHAFRIGEVDRDRHRRLPDGHRRTVVGHQQPDLLEQIVGEEVRPGDRRRVGARPRHEAVGEPGIHPPERLGGDLDLRIDRPHAPLRDPAVANHRLEPVAQEGRVALVDCGQPGHRRGGIAERLRRPRRRMVQTRGRRRFARLETGH